MKKTTRILWLSVCLCFCLGVQAQNFNMDWYSIDGGGGASTGGIYLVSGTIGQPDAGRMSGGNFTLEGGFWPGLVQIAGAPTLRMTLAGPGQVTISWTPNSSGWILQQNVNLSPTNWINSASGSTNPVTVPVNSARSFYRLFKP